MKIDVVGIIHSFIHSPIDQLPNTLFLLPQVDFAEFAQWWKHKGHSRFSAKLSQIINKRNENVKYLPGIKLGGNVTAVPRLEDAVKDATVLAFVSPHQFIEGIVKQVKPMMRKDVDVRAISLIKGMSVTEDGFHLISDVISKVGLSSS